MMNLKMNYYCSMTTCSYRSASSTYLWRSHQVQTAGKLLALELFLLFVFSAPLVARWVRLASLWDIGWVLFPWRIRLSGLLLRWEEWVWILAVIWKCLCTRNRRLGRKHGRGLRPWSCRGIDMSFRLAECAAKSASASDFRRGCWPSLWHLGCLADQTIAL